MLVGGASVDREGQRVTIVTSVGLDVSDQALDDGYGKRSHRCSHTRPSPWNSFRYSAKKLSDPPRYDCATE